MKCTSCGTDNVDGARFCASCGASLSGEQGSGHSLVGQMVGGRYQVKSVLGEGGMGVVYEAEQQMGSTVRKVALKTLHAHLSHDPAVSARFNRECGTIAQLEHPNTIKVYDFGATPDGTLYIAMEFVAGKPLSKLIEESGALPPDRVLKIVKQIAGSLQEAHQQGVIHRDLKPDNVVLTQRAGEKDVVKLLDFGIAARTESADAQKEQKLTQQGMVLGTPPYMSPEQFTGKALDARSDIYSLGVMVYEMLTGRLPFDAATPWQWATEHMTAQPLPFEASPVSSQIPPQMRAAVLRSLSKNRDDRQASVQAFYDELAGAAPVPEPVAAHTGTAAMAAPPVFAGAAAPSAKTAAMVTPAASPAVAPVAPVPPRASGGNKGLVLGLAAVGGVLLIAIVVVAARSMKPSAEPVAAPPTPPPPPATTIAPPPETAQPADTAPPVATAQPVAAAETVPPPARPHESPTPTKPTSTAKSTTTTPPPPTASGCAGCISAANAGNFVGAANAFRSCSDAGQKATCAGIARVRAPQAVQQAAFNGNCAQAKAIAAAAEAMGVPAGMVTRPLSAAKCN